MEAHTTRLKKLANAATGTKIYISGWNGIVNHFSYYYDVQQAIITDGAVLMDIFGTESLYETGSDGIVPDEGRDDNIWGHAICVLGWKYIGGELYWMVQNSWGKYWGKMDLDI